MLAGGSVVAGWYQLERTGPKDDRQVTSGLKVRVERSRGIEIRMTEA